MLKKEIITGLLITIFSISLAGIAFAEHGEDSPHSNIVAKQNHKTKGEVNTPHRDGSLTGKKTSDPLNCDDELSISTEEFTSDYCRNLYEDIYRN